jgi:hypothetical protein
MTRKRAAPAAALLCLAVARTVMSITDPADNLGVAAANSNLKVASNDGIDLAQFGGDSGRFERAAKGPASLSYVEQARIEAVEIAFFGSSNSFTDGTWGMTFILGGVEVGTLGAEADIGAQLSGASSGSTVRY